MCSNNSSAEGIPLGYSCARSLLYYSDRFWRSLNDLDTSGPAIVAMVVASSDVDHPVRVTLVNHWMAVTLMNHWMAVALMNHWMAVALVNHWVVEALVLRRW